MSDEFHAVIVGAGSGSRFGGAKWRVPLAGRRVVDYAVRPFALCYPRIQSITLMLPAGESIASELPQVPSGMMFREVEGGATRADSVLRGLDAVAMHGADDCWVLVHDVARPCVWQSDIDGMLQEPDEQGMLLAIPVIDSLKRASKDQRIQQPVDREDLWRAQTPQMFRLQALREALRRAQAEDITVTDESSAMEHCGYAPRLLRCGEHNIKLTWPDDITRAEQILQEDPDDAYWTRL